MAVVPLDGLGLSGLIWTFKLLCRDQHYGMQGHSPLHFWD